MYNAVIRQFEKSLANLDTILGKATDYAESRGFPVDNLMTARLAPDMLPFWRQVTVACDIAKASATVFSGKTNPKFDDNETTIAELRARIGKTLELLGTITEADLSKLAADAQVPIPYPAGKFMLAHEALVTRSIPNFYFHIVTAYALLRAGGVPIGKLDYLGQLNLLDG